MYLLSCLSVKVRNILGKLQYLLYPVINYYIVLLKLKISAIKSICPNMQSFIKICGRSLCLQYFLKYRTFEKGEYLKLFSN